MANWCSIALFVRGIDHDATTAILDKLYAEYGQAQGENRNMYIGCSKRYVDAPDVSNYWAPTGRMMARVLGGVRWCLYDEDMCAIIDWLKAIAGIDYVECRMEERGTMLYGIYRYQDGLLTYEYLPEEFYPDDDVDDGGECFNDRLNDAFDKHSKLVQIGGM